MAVIRVLVFLSLAVAAAATHNAGWGFVATHGKRKDYAFSSYWGTSGAAFNNSELETIPSFPSVATPSRTSLSNKTLKVDTLEKCFQKCVEAKNCHTFDYTPETKVCTHWPQYLLAADGSDGKELVKVCIKKGMIAGYLGHNPKESVEDKGEKKNCTDEALDAAIEKCSKSKKPCSGRLVPVCYSSKGFRCACFA